MKVCSRGVLSSSLLHRENGASDRLCEKDIIVVINIPKMRESVSSYLHGRITHSSRKRAFNLVACSKRLVQIFDLVADVLIITGNMPLFVI
jgi:hypothetical protein